MVTFASNTRTEIRHAVVPFWNFFCWGWILQFYAVSGCKNLQFCAVCASKFAVLCSLLVKKMQFCAVIAISPLSWWVVRKAISRLETIPSIVSSPTIGSWISHSFPSRVLCYKSLRSNHFQVRRRINSRRWLISNRTIEFLPDAYTLEYNLIQNAYTLENNLIQTAYVLERFFLIYAYALEFCCIFAPENH